MNRNIVSSALHFSTLLVIAFCAVLVQAQSGRRQTKPPQADPIPTPTPEPTPKPKAQDKEPEMGFLVGVDRNSSQAVFPFSFYDAVLRGCTARLRAGSDARVDASQVDMNRSDAVKKAKAEQETYVVLLQLQGAAMSGSSNYDEIELDFVVFAPVTAKVVVTGRSYPNANRKGPLVVGPTSRIPGGALYSEQMLRYAGEDAATRILKAMHLNR